MFIEPGGEIKVELFIKKGSNGTVQVETDLLKVPEKDRAKYEKVTFSMKPLTWKQHNDIQRASIIDRGPMGREIDWVNYKERKLCAVLKGWDVKDKNDKPIPVNDENIFRLCPQVAENLLNAFDTATIMGDEERKN
jgi:hypothetical protein